MWTLDPDPRPTPTPLHDSRQDWGSKVKLWDSYEAGLGSQGWETPSQGWETRVGKPGLGTPKRLGLPHPPLRFSLPHCLRLNPGRHSLLSTPSSRSSSRGSQGTLGGGRPRQARGWEKLPAPAGAVPLPWVPWKPGRSQERALWPGPCTRPDPLVPHVEAHRIPFGSS